MVDIEEITSKTLCCTCLASTRKLLQLCRVPNGVNNLYSLLFHDAEAYREGFYKNTATLYVCWECKALLRRLSAFRKQICKAQILYTRILEKQQDIKNTNLCFTNLSESYKNTYDVCCESKCNTDIHYENFVDCGDLDTSVKNEDDFDELPITEFYSDEHHTDSYINNKADEVKHESQDDEIKPEENGEAVENNVQPEHRHNSNVIKSSLTKGCSNKNKKKVRKKDTPKRHLKDKPEKKKKDKPKKLESYPCKECQKHFKNRSQRWKHMQKCHSEGYECAECGKRFAYKYNLARHVQQHVVVAPRVACERCGKLVRWDLRRAHHATHAPRVAHRCVLCDVTFVSRASYEHHLKATRAHNASMTHVLKHKCSHCGKGYRSGAELRDHVNYQHFSRTKHKCPICDKALATPRCITRHVNRVHKGIKEAKKDKICPKCGKTFRDSRSLSSHACTHTDTPTQHSKLIRVT